MPTPRTVSIKNATGRLYECLKSSSNSLPPQLRSASSSHQSAQPQAQSVTQRRDIHSGIPHPSQRHQVRQQSNSSRSSTPDSEFLAHITANAWSTSVINPGFPFDIPTFNQPAVNEPVEVAPVKILAPPYDTAATFWSLSPVFGDFSFLPPQYHLPLRSTEAYDNIMASDEDYTAFLDKANADRQSAPTTQSKPATQQKTVNTQQLHPALQNIQQHTYTSDADEPFAPVSLSRAAGKSGAVNKSEVAHLAGESEDKVSELSKKDFDPRGEYEAVWKHVTEASEGAAKAFKVERGGARSEYWVLGVCKDGHVVGARATAVES